MPIRNPLGFQHHALEGAGFFPCSIKKSCQLNLSATEVHLFGILIIGSKALVFLRLLEGAFEAMPQTIIQGIVLYEETDRGGLKKKTG